MRNKEFTFIDPFDDSIPPPRLCERQGCQGFGEFRAPKSQTSLREYYWFCLDHVREYNKSWDFYKGMSPEQIESSRISDMTWNRPSWPVGGWRTLLENIHYLDGIDPFINVSSFVPPVPVPVQKALNVLEISLPMTLEALKKHYKALVKSHHPDLHPNDKNAEDRLKAINEAYHIVKKHLNYK
jgi:DnaJ-domain-containing protein 1